MKDPADEALRFNALTDAWLPLVQEDGTTVWASPVEVLCGERDGVDLDYPRDDFRVYARLLLSALVQALFPARTKAELIQRLERPLVRSEVEARIGPVLDDFELFGPTPFLQIVAPAKPPDGGAAPFVFPAEDLFRSQVPVEAMSVPLALVSVFAEQTYAGGAGRGHPAGPAGQLGVLTLVDPGSVRTAAWGNTLTSEHVSRLYVPDRERPWSNEKQPPRPRASLGIVEGLLFQKRGVWLTPAGVGVCSFTGAVTQLVRRGTILEKSELTKKPASGEDLWQHPCAPLAVNSQGIGAIRLSAERPAWTGLAQLLSPLSGGKGKKEHPREGPAPVLQQWKTLGGYSKRPRLLVLDFVRDKANVKGRFFESFPLTEQFLQNPEVVAQIRALADDAQQVRLFLVRALTSAHDDRKQGGLALADAEAGFWTASEAPFLDWLAVVAGIDTWDEEADARVERARQAMHAATRRAALSLFNAHVSVSEFDPRKQERVARARRSLSKSLFPATKAVSSAPRTEVIK